MMDNTSLTHTHTPSNTHTHISLTHSTLFFLPTHTKVYHGSTSEGEDVDTDDNTHRPGSHCMATARSGIPPR
jgi:hypothetical protein